MSQPAHVKEEEAKAAVIRSQTEKLVVAPTEQDKTGVNQGTASKFKASIGVWTIQSTKSGNNTLRSQGSPLLKQKIANDDIKKELEVSKKR